MDYELHPAREKGKRMPGDALIKLRNEIGANPAMVFGANSKLRSDGPFLAMLVELDSLLAHTEWLTIVGYSFRDAHINRALTRWMNGDAAKRLSVIDPEVEEWMASDGRGPSYFKKLWNGAKGEGTEFGRPALWQGIEFNALPAFAKDGIRSLHA
ncbi:hypothetical protein ACPW96_14115 [Micromonospora sp. DT81.3]|uniref:hypothetical protein n=1 Tax=Micromonospora sp. DT81.3 TaxID=3416523 RepID=UPI003CF66624